MAKEKFEDKLVNQAKSLRALLKQRSQLEAQAADFAAQCNAAKSAAQALNVQIEEATADLRKVAVSDD